MWEGQVDVYGGVNTHRDVHVAAVLESTGRILGTASFAADTDGYEQLGNWLGSQGRVVRAGIEGTGSYGTRLARHLTSIGNRGGGSEPSQPPAPTPPWQTDTADAQAAARAVLSGQATGVPKSGNGSGEAIRMVMLARRSAIKARTQAINQLHALVVTAPHQISSQLEGLPGQSACQDLCRLPSRHN